MCPPSFIAIKEEETAFVAMKEVAMEEEKKEISSSAFFLIEKGRMVFGEKEIFFSFFASITQIKEHCLFGMKKINDFKSQPILTSDAVLESCESGDHTDIFW